MQSAKTRSAGRFRIPGLVLCFTCNDRLRPRPCAPPRPAATKMLSDRCFASNCARSIASSARTDHVRSCVRAGDLRSGGSVYSRVGGGRRHIAPTLTRIDSLAYGARGIVSGQPPDTFPSRTSVGIEVGPVLDRRVRVWGKLPIAVPGGPSFPIPRRAAGRNRGRGRITLA